MILNVYLLQEVILENWTLTSGFLKADPLLGCLCVPTYVDVPEVDTVDIIYPGLYEWVKDPTFTHLDEIVDMDAG